MPFLSRTYSYEKRIGISLNLKYGRFTLYRASLEVMGFPEYYRFLLNLEEKKLVVQACSIDNKGAHRLPEIKQGQTCDIKCIQMVRLIFKNCRWDENCTYRISGTGFPERRLVQYDLTNAMAVESGIGDNSEV